MKKILLFIGAVTLSLSMQAQIKLTAKTHGFKVGDSHNFVFSKCTNEGLSGANVVWDFSNLELVGQTLTSHMLTPDNFSNNIEKSNLVLEEFGNLFYFNTSNDGMLQYGSVNCNVVTRYDKPFVKLKFPFTYGNKVGGNYSGTQTTANNISTQVSGKYEIFADAYGTLLLPGNITIENTLRVRQTRLIEYANSTNTLTEITYRWYAEDVRYPVLVIIKYVTENSSNITQTAIYTGAQNNKKSASESTAVVTEGISGLEVFPNPYNEQLTLKYQLDKAENVKIEFYDVEGRLFKTALQSKQNAGPQIYNLKASEDGMMPGVYYLKVSTEDKSYTRKIVKL